MQIYKKNRVSNDIKGISKKDKKDKVQLSDKAKEFQVAMNALKEVPDIRKDKVEEIKKQIETGTYRVDSGKIVEKIFDSIKFDKRV